MSDLISRQDAIETIRKFQTYKLFQKDNMLLVDQAEVMTELMLLPSADRPTMDREYLIDLIQEAVYDGEACAKLIDLVDRPTGEWIEVTNGRGGHECSECHSYAPSYASGDEHLSDYCPNCGADMRHER